MTTHTAGTALECFPLGQYVPADLLRCYRTELSSDLLDEQGEVLDHLISFAFDTLNVQVLDVRVVPAKDRPPVTRQESIQSAHAMG
jgi:hypothetical protein